MTNYPSGIITIDSRLTASGHIGWSVRGQDYNGTPGPYVASGTVQLNGGNAQTSTLSGWPLWQVFFAPVGEPNNLMSQDGIGFDGEGEIQITIVQTQAPQ